MKFSHGIEAEISAYWKSQVLEGRRKIEITAYAENRKPRGIAQTNPGGANFSYAYAHIEPFFPI